MQNAGEDDVVQSSLVVEVVGSTCLPDDLLQPGRLDHPYDEARSVAV